MENFEGRLCRKMENLEGHEGLPTTKTFKQRPVVGNKVKVYPPEKRGQDLPRFGIVIDIEIVSTKNGMEDVERQFLYMERLVLTEVAPFSAHEADFCLPESKVRFT